MGRTELGIPGGSGDGDHASDVSGRWQGARSRNPRSGILMQRDAAQRPLAEAERWEFLRNQLRRMGPGGFEPPSDGL